MARHYPALAKLSKITIYDVASNILGTFDQSLRRYVCLCSLISEALAQLRIDEDTRKKLCRVKVSVSSQAIMLNVWKRLVPLFGRDATQLLSGLLTG